LDQAVQAETGVAAKIADEGVVIAGMANSSIAPSLRETNSSGNAH
jgi:hypothetical protein